MINQLFKIIWHQRNKNSWIILELFIVFVVMWFIIDYFVVLFLMSRTPQNFEVDHVYHVVLSLYQPENPHYQMYEEGSEEPLNNLFRIIDRLKQHEAVESISLSEFSFPYNESSRSYKYTLDSTYHFAWLEKVTPDYFEVFRVYPEGSGGPAELQELIRKGVIISRSFNEEFSTTSLVGKNLYRGDEKEELRVSGIMKNMKPAFFAATPHYVFEELTVKDMAGMSETELWDNIHICFRVLPGRDRKDFRYTFKNEMKNDLRAGNFFMMDIVSLDDYGKRILKSNGVNTEIYYRSGFSVFFLISVFLGVIGTFWLRISRRRGEVGLRMAIGSTQQQVTAYIALESFLLFMIAIVPAFLICINLVYLDLLSTDRMALTFNRLMLNTLLTAGILLLVISLATWYPAWRSAQEQPAEALHYE